MTATDVHHAQETSPRFLVFQLLGTAHSVTDRFSEALGGLGLSLPGLDRLTQLAQAPETLPLAEPEGEDPRELVVMLERDGLVRRVTDGAEGGRVTIALTPLGAARQRVGAERLDAARQQL